MTVATTFDQTPWLQFFHCSFLNGYYSRVVTIQRNMIRVLPWYEASRKYMVHESSEQKAEIPYSGKFLYGAKFCIFHINSRCKNLNYQKIFPCKILKTSKFWFLHEEHRTFYRYLQPSDTLSDSNGCLSSSISPSAIKDANEAVRSATRKRKIYQIHSQTASRNRWKCLTAWQPGGYPLLTLAWQFLTDNTVAQVSL